MLRFHEGKDMSPFTIVADAFTSELCPFTIGVDLRIPIVLPAYRVIQAWALSFEIVRNRPPNPWMQIEKTANCLTDECSFDILHPFGCLLLSSAPALLCVRCIRNSGLYIMLPFRCYNEHLTKSSPTQRILLPN